MPRSTTAADVLIHVADGLVHGDVDYADRIEERLLAAGLRVARRDLTAMPAAPGPARAHVFTGGETSVNSDAPWMRAAVATARGLVDGAEHGDHAVIGICLGSQILAEALCPGSIANAPAIEVGLAVVERPGDHLVRQAVPAFHYQAISPAIGSVGGVRIEWGNAHTAVQAFSYGRRTFGCQFHPELSAADLHRLIDRHRDLIVEYGAHPETAHRSVDEHAGALSPDLFRQMVVDRILNERSAAPVAIP